MTSPPNARAETTTPPSLAQENRNLRRQIKKLRDQLQTASLATMAAALSEPSLSIIWDNPEDAAYDEL